MHIATADPDKADSFKDQTLKDDLSIKKDDIKTVLKEFKKNAADDIFFRYLARLVIDNYDNDFDFYYRLIQVDSSNNIFSGKSTLSAVKASISTISLSRTLPTTPNSRPRSTVVLQIMR